MEQAAALLAATVAFAGLSTLVFHMRAVLLRRERRRAGLNFETFRRDFPLEYPDRLVESAYEHFSSILLGAPILAEDRLDSRFGIVGASVQDELEDLCESCRIASPVEATSSRIETVRDAVDTLVDLSSRRGESPPLRSVSPVPRTASEPARS